MMELVISHNAGFFSNMAVILTRIVEYINQYEHYPVVNSSASFQWYKSKTNKNDITYEYFLKPTISSISEATKHKVDFIWDYQFTDYRNLDYKNICPVMKMYFSPSKQILELKKDIESKYDLSYNNLSTLFYRGNDKAKETGLCSYDCYLKHATKILTINPQTTFLIQSDETEFIDFMRSKFPNNSFYFEDEIRHMNKCNTSLDLLGNDNYLYSLYFLAIVIIMSKSQYIVCNSGNISEFICLYRGNAKNVYQNLNNEWLS